jgi:hypothetical protein
MTFLVRLASRLALCAALFAATGSGLAQPVAPAGVDATLLGITEAELQSRISELQRARRPQPGPRGLRGAWVLPPVTASGLPFDTVFFVRNSRVVRIEQRAATGEQACRDPATFAQLATSLSAKYGNALLSSDPPERETTRQSAVWEGADFNVLLSLALAPGQCTLMLVYEERANRDPAEL